MMNVQDIDENSFAEVLAKNKMVLVDFWAAWCGPCRNFALTYNVVAEQLPEIKFTKVNIDENHKLATEFNIRSIPHLMIFRGQEVVYSQPGALNTKQLIDLIKKTQLLDSESGEIKN
jgi:thioredoxin